MKKDISCPGEKLEELIFNLKYIDFNWLSEKPNREEEDREYIKLYPDADELKLKENYKAILSIYTSIQKSASEIFKYGSNKEEISDRLRKHAGMCRECLENYFRILKEDVYELINRGIIKIPETKFLFTSDGPWISKKSVNEKKEMLYQTMKIADVCYLRVLSD